MVSSRVVNIAHHPKKPYDVYIGRPGKWGNPFVVGRDGTREECITLYRKYVTGNPKLMGTLDELQGKILGCWCAPKACHGDVLLELVERDHE